MGKEITESQQKEIEAALIIKIPGFVWDLLNKRPEMLRRGFSERTLWDRAIYELIQERRDCGSRDEWNALKKLDSYMCFSKDFRDSFVEGRNLLTNG